MVGGDTEVKWGEHIRQKSGHVHGGDERHWACLEEGD